MKVIYKKLYEELDEAITAAALQGKRIAQFELTKAEFETLKNELYSLCFFRSKASQPPHSEYNGIPIKVIE